MANRIEALLRCSLAELRERLLVRGRPVPRGLLEALESDPRQGARQLAATIRARIRERRREGQRLRRLLRHERELWSSGYQRIAGVDEAGVAPLAGPVVAAAVILPRGYRLAGLNDSKKIPDEEKRRVLAGEIRKNAVAWSVGRAEVEEIDRLNIYRASLLAMQRAVLGLNVPPEYVLVDARTIPRCPFPQRGIVHGDELSASIAAASILAKTSRDAWMADLDETYRGYGFASHKGYPTAEHFRALERLGACPVHRRSFEPVRRALGLAPIQRTLF